MKLSTQTALTAIVLTASSSVFALDFDQDVTSDIIFGDGNANGSFTVDRASGVELGLRAKLRHNASGAPENTFNSNGDGTYTYNPGVAPTQSFPTAEWSFEWSINSDYDNTSGDDLDDLTYILSMTSTTGAFIPAFDPINSPNLGNAGQVQWDHAIGTNLTGNGDGTSVPNDGDADDDGYGALIAANNLAQNSWKPHWFAAGFDPTQGGTYTFELTAFDGANEVASTSMGVVVVPEPGSIAALAIGGLTMLRRRRK